ncbi:hypothetical protein [Isoptericola croceus]|uniref:hypothetical protein n=1 Tax=Isoptericola croceus TaxID=3031406 RepID=UPI0023F8387C|nr:hypothetical protein [Isoptericola croceus]
MAGRPPVVTTSVLDAPRSVLWRHATSFAGIGAELWPWLDMTTPRGLRARRLDENSVSVPLGRSVLLLGGVLPVEYDDIVVAELEPGRRFLERSSMLTSGLWEHERVLEDVGPAASQVRDTVRFRLRGALRHVPGVEHLARSMVTAVFAHRHRRLRRHFGVPGTARPAAPPPATSRRRRRSAPRAGR